MANEELSSLTQRLEQMRLESAEFSSRLRDVVGAGEALDGEVRIVCGAGGAIERVRLTPRAMGATPQELGEAIKEAHAAATRAATEAIQQALSESGTLGESIGKFQRGEIGVLDMVEQQGVPVRDLLRKLESRP